MSFLISDAYAQAAAAGPDPTSGLTGLLPFVVMFVIIWFIMIRPQMKKAKEHQKMVGALQKGDEVVTQGGIAGRVTRVGEGPYVTVEVAQGKDGPVEVIVQKAAIGTLLPKGTLKSL